VIEDTFRFRHILIRDAAYERIPKELRSDLHERYADWLDGRGEQFDEIVGYHLEQAFRSVADLGPVGDRARALAERAAERLTASGRRANIRGDARAAANMFDRTMALHPVDDRRRLMLLPWLGRALREIGEMDRAASVLSEAVERGRAAGDRAVTADAMVALSDIRFHRATISRQELVRELENAIAVFEELGDDEGLARALGLSGNLRFWRGEARPRKRSRSSSGRRGTRAMSATGPSTPTAFITSWWRLSTAPCRWSRRWSESTRSAPARGETEGLR
jgi:hypothetical protein